MRIDAHQHYWQPGHGDYGWLVPSEELKTICRDFAPADLHPLLDAAGIDATVLVQAAPAEAETHRLLAIAATPGSRVLGVVGWCDLEAADAPQRVEALARNPLLKGLRPMLQDMPDAQWVLRETLHPAFNAMESAGLAMDLLIKPHQLDAALRFARRRPDLRMVIDHGAKPDIRAGKFRDWAAGMTRLARETRVMCKLSGLLTEAPAGAGASALQPYAEHLLAEFGPGRLMWGSDWPVLNLASSYAQWHGMCALWLEPLSAADRALVLGGNAQAFYRLQRP
jgi:L-fuconolactonase